MWLDKQTTLYKTHSDNIGVPRALRQVLLIDFANDINILCKLRRLDRNTPDYKQKKNNLKSKLQGFTPSAFLESRAKNDVRLVSRTGLLHLDFDCDSIMDYDIEELKLAVFALPFIAFCGLSCSGDGFYALALIAEPERLEDYARHCFYIFKEKYGIGPDTSKGTNPAHLRYVSWDANMLIREEPRALQLFDKIQNGKKAVNKSEKRLYMAKDTKSDRFVQSQFKRLHDASEGQRIPTIQKVSFTLGGLGDPTLLQTIKEILCSNLQYKDGLERCLRCADDCFQAGAEKPIHNRIQSV